MKFKIVTMLFFSLMVSTSFSMEVNKQVIGDKGISSSSGLTINKNVISQPGENFVKTITARIQTMNYLVNLHNRTRDYYDVLQLLVFMNQTSQLEKKMDVLIDEIRLSNHYLARQDKEIAANRAFRERMEKDLSSTASHLKNQVDAMKIDTE